MRIKPITIASGFGILLIIIYLLIRQGTWAEGVDVELVTVSFLDIGQGDATFFAWSDGTQMLVDCAKDAVVLEALGRVMPFHDRHIDYLMVTHPDLDHYGGCIDVLRRYDIEEVILNGDTKGDGYWKAFMEEVNAEGAAVRYVDTSESWGVASALIKFLYPDHDMLLDPDIPGAHDTGSNNGSIVFTLDVLGTELLMMGDAEAELEEYLLSKDHDLDIDILKASHHGSGGASVQPFIASTTPSATIFSAGRKNQYGHPSERVVRRVERAGSSVYRTDTQGDITLRIYRDRVYTISAQYENLIH